MMKAEKVEVVVDYIPVTISGICYRDPNKYHYDKHIPFEEKARAFTFFFERDGDIHSASSKTHSHLGASFFNDAFGAEQLKKIKYICKKVGRKAVKKAEAVEVEV